MQRSFERGLSLSKRGVQEKLKTLVETETLRLVQVMLETMKDQANAIRALELRVLGPNETFCDGIDQRIERLAERARDLESSRARNENGRG